MPRDLPYYQQLLDRYLDGQCTPQEVEEIMEFLERDVAGKLLLQKMQTAFNEAMNAKSSIPAATTARVLARLLSRVAPVKRIPFYKRPFFRVAAAAVLLLAVVTGGYFLFFDKAKTGVIAQARPAAINDISAPSKTNAVVILANGKKVYLDSIGNGSLAVQGNTKLVKRAGGGIAYEAMTGNALQQVQYNTLENPRGSRVVDMVLADGSRVWLNAGSSLRFPVVFVGNERNVSMTGEAYFEVAHDAQKPFIVSKGKMNIEVLGTHFNVNAYEEENNSKVTLLEGAVKVKEGSKSGFLKPGQQARVNGDIEVVNEVDLDEVMAWKNGRFQFNRASLQEVMRQLSRWYDVEVSYEGDIPPQQFVGEIQRSLSLSEVMDGLGKSRVHYRIEGKKIIVQP